jgi:hypothetical protein
VPEPKLDGAIELLRPVARYPALNTESFLIYQTYFREYLADAIAAGLEPSPPIEIKQVSRV